MTAIASASGPLKFDCGKSFNIPRTLIISEKPAGSNSFYPLAAEYQTAGADATTGTLTAVTYSLDGDTDLQTGDDGKDLRVFAFIDSKNPEFQVTLVQPEKVGDVVEAAEISVRNNSVTKFECKLVSGK